MRTARSEGRAKRPGSIFSGTSRGIAALDIETSGRNVAPSPMRRSSALALLVLAFLVGGCASTPPYVYHYVPGRSAILRDGYAEPPASAPSPVLLAIAAGNRIAGSPYSYGGGHAREIDSGYDCSGATSYVLNAAGSLHGSMPSDAFRHYGESGPGKWITVYARRGHVFLVVAGLRFDTGWSGDASSGPRWTTHSRPATYCVLRHPRGL